jgi:hexosaminidase
VSLALALLAAGQSFAVGVVPLPAEIIPGQGVFHLDASTAVCGPQSQYLGELLKRPISCTPGGRSISFVRTEGLPPEGYRLEITPQRVVVTATTDAGLFYGAVTLWQLLPDAPAQVIRDEPVYRWRGLMLDSARHFQSPTFIKSFIDWMALHKLNVLQWHLTDDQGWRLQIRKYPKLTSVGAWRVPAVPAISSETGHSVPKPPVYGGFYTQEQVKDIVAFAASRHVQIVPEIELPGHATAAIAAYPEVGLIDGPPPPVSAKWGIHSAVFNPKPETLAFLEDVLTEVMELFPSHEIHVGGDEAAKAAAYQTDFTQKIGRFLESHGRRLVGWDEILQPGLPKDAIVMSWRGTAGAHAAAEAGNDAVLAAWPTLYFDNRQSTLKIEPPGRTKVISLEDVYKFEPRDPALTPQQQKHILGVQGNVWTEHIRTEARVEWMTFPRAAAVAEVGWTAPERRQWADFRQRVEGLLGKLQTVGLHAATSEFIVPDELPPGPRRTSRELELCSDGVGLLLEAGKGGQAIEGARETSIVALDIMNPCWIWRHVNLSHAVKVRASMVALPFNFELGDDAKKIQLGKKSQFEIRVDKCDGPPLATAPLNTLVAHLPAMAGSHDLCMRFARPRLDPMWALDWVEVR